MFTFYFDFIYRLHRFFNLFFIWTFLRKYNFCTLILPFYCVFLLLATLHVFHSISYIYICPLFTFQCEFSDKFHIIYSLNLLYLFINCRVSCFFMIYIILNFIALHTHTVFGDSGKKSD